MQKKLSIIIPVFNEKKTIEEIIRRVEAVDISLEKEIIIVDDFSTDGTREILSRLNKNPIKVYLQEKNYGKGAAVKRGLQECSGDIAIIQDADLEYDPADYKEMIAPIFENNADVVFGSRFIGNKPHRVLYFWHYVGNKVLTLFSNMMTNQNITDMETCYKLFNRKSIDVIKNEITADRFGVEPEITAIVAKNKFVIYEVGISYSGRTYEEGKKIGWKDGFSALYYIIRSRIRHW